MQNIVRTAVAFANTAGGTTLDRCP
ncbi:MAG: hypothetical protein WBM23_00440 [Desulfomonilia bacterium]